jgi:hypothetical protein
MDGYVRTHKIRNSTWYDQKAGYYGKFDVPKDNAEIVLVVEDKVLSVFVNEKLIVQYEDTYIEKGNLALSLASGTNKGFGTKCEMKNIDYWDIN